MEPILRFKADDGSDFSDWEKMTLGDVCVFVRNGYAYSSDGSRNHRYKLTRIESISGGVINDEKLGSSDEIDPRYRLVDGDILFSNINSLPYLGNVARYTNDLGEIYHGMNLLCIRPRANEINSIFLFELLGTSRIRRYEITHAKAAVNQCSLPSSDVKAMSLYCPSLPEQRKIADLLSAVDDVITTQEAEVAAWEKRKKGVMQKLFSQEVRFKADDGSDFPDWEEKALGDLGHFVRGLSYDKTQVLDEGSDASGTAVLRSNNINSDGTLNYRDDVQLVSKEPSSEQQLCENDVVICMANGSNRLVGKAARYDGGYDAGQITVGAFCGIFRTDSPLVPWWFQSDDYKSFLHLSKQGGDGALANLKGKDIEAISLLFPSSSTEQREIADCLASLDDVIAKAKDELDAWRELKKGLLQQMFV